MPKISLDVPIKIHLQVKQMQLDREKEGKIINLKELYYELIEKSLKDNA